MDYVNFRKVETLDHLEHFVGGMAGLDFSWDEYRVFWGGIKSWRNHFYCVDRSNREENFCFCQETKSVSSECTPEM